MFADAFAACSYDETAVDIGPTVILFGVPFHQSFNAAVSADTYLQAVRTQMQTGLCVGGSASYAGIQPPEAAWFAQRNDAKCNIDPSTKAAASANLQRTVAPITVPLEGPFVNSQGANGFTRIALETPIMNFCIAQHLRSQAPGTMGGQTLLLSAADQRELLELEKERAQLAMLQFALLEETFTTPPISNPQTVTDDTASLSGFSLGYPGSFIPVLQEWAQAVTPARTDLSDRLQLLTLLGQDFGGAVELHAQVSQELAGLLSRSGSARLPRGGDSTNDATETWGSGAWRQRALASLFGGDPIVQDADNTSPWQHFLQQTEPGQSGETWPDVAEDPFVATHMTDPEVAQLWKLAAQYDALFLQKTPDFQPVDATTQCHTVVVPSAASRLYRAVEAGLRTSDCVTFNATTKVCQSYAVTDIPDPATLSDGYGSFELWTRFQITPMHATELVQLASQEIGQECQKQENGTFQPYSGRGPLDLNGSIDSVVVDGSTPAYHVAPTSIFRPRVLREVAGMYGRNAHFAMPTSIDPTSDASTQGYEVNVSTLGTLPGNAHEAMRTMGGVAALAAVRTALAASQANLPSASAGVQAFAATNRQILDLVNGAAGQSQLTVSPVTAAISSPITLSVNGFPVTLNRSIRTQAGSAAAEQWGIDLVVPPSDTFYDATNPGNYKLIAISNDPWATVLARHPGAQTFGARDIAATVSASGAETSSATSVQTVSLGSNPVSIWHFNIALNSTGAQRSLIVQQVAVGSTTYKPLLSNLELRTDTVHQMISDGQYFAFEGALSNAGQTIITRDAFDPASPAFDGFGLPNRLAPPTDPSLFSGAAGTDAVANYLSQAEAAAQNATQSVTQTFEELLNEEQDQSQLAAAVAKQQALDDLQRSALCGTGSTCDTSVVNFSLNIAAIWDSAPPTRTVASRDSNTYAVTTSTVPRPEYNAAVLGCGNGSFNGNDADALDCLTISTLRSIPSSTRILNVVAQHLNDPNPQNFGITDISPPPFTEFSGGTLQTVAIQQWLAIQKAKAEALAVISASDAAFSQVQSFDDAFFRAENENVEMTTKCSLHALSVAFSGCPANEGTPNPPPCFAADSDPSKDAWDDENSSTYSSGSSQSSSFDFGASFFVSLGGSTGGGTSSGFASSAPSLAEKIRLCEAYQDKLSSAQWQLLDAQLEAVASIQEKASEFLELGAQIQESSASALQLIHQTDLAIATEALETNVLAASQKTSFGLYRQIHSYDVFRSQALLDNARLMADVARKAIEAHYVVNLSELTQPEPFVASPSTWADDIYQYDLSMPDTVGLSIGDAVPGGVSLNKVLDYVDNLQRFVQGYAIARPTAVAQADTAVLTLPGPAGLDDGTSTVTQLPDGRSSAWSFYCPSTATSVPLPVDLNPMDACLPGDLNPSRATLQFELDPWGRVDGDYASPPYALRYNERWTSLAVNLVGTGVLDCTKAADPLGCYSKSYVTYNLTQAGIPWITDSNETWNILGVPTGQIEGAKALAAEQWLDPINNAWDKPYVAQVTRTEFVQRPYGGRYEIELQLAPEVQLQNIERVQVLAGSTYWVSQK